ncbi:choline-binding protein [Lactobacillus xylocopicola]|uniref:Uncharacterized protein n=1 Tax=Lactobacillus xylocopicola TaxID=2976676 RepID=A0ABM8BFJ9_9LACO|nr:choline-binding protein [Lactobacillus xylocopicola]BDR60036.1 hypothetical protein KIM322_02970 [Lactobacillus xylocopicola]
MSFFKKHVWGKSMIAATTVLALGSASVVGAAKKSKGTWTVTPESVAAHGTWSSYGSGNVKKTNSNDASFNGDVVPNWTGYNVRLINSKASPRSSFTKLKKNKTTYAGENTGKKRYIYYADVRSKRIEPNKSRVKLHFSSDHK